jgi:REP element-mobilizing transposase RayT
MSALRTRRSTEVVHVAPRGWHSRGYLPHFDGGEVTQAVTFRLVGSVPSDQIARWKVQLALLPRVQAERRLRARMERYLDRHFHVAYLRDPQVGALVEGALLHFDHERYSLHGWVVMPNHVHVLLTPREDQSLSGIVKSWKSYTAKAANRILGRTGTFWQEDYFDRYTRNARHFGAVVEYIEYNPVGAGLCERRADWPYSSAGRRAEVPGTMWV